MTIHAAASSTLIGGTFRPVGIQHRNDIAALQAVLVAERAKRIEEAARGQESSE